VADQLAVIQGTADVSGKLSQKELGETLDFCAAAFDETQPEEKDRVLKEIMANGKGVMDKAFTPRDEVQKSFHSEELRVIDNIRARHVLDIKSSGKLDNFSVDVIDGMKVNLQRGKLGLVKVTPEMD
jgi:hypothetical protein